MRKSILALALISSAHDCSAVAEPLSLLTHQCQQLSFASNFEQKFKDSSSRDSATQARDLDRLTLGLNNLADQLSYFLAKPLPSSIRDSLLSCKIRLADEVSTMIDSPAFSRLSQTFSAAPEREINALGDAMAFMAATQLPQDEKARLHSAEASYMSHRRRDGFTLNTSPECSMEGASTTADLTSALDEAHQVPISIERQMASYLMRQPDPNCRELAWKAFQRRNYANGSASLALIQQIRAKQAQAAGFKSFAHMQLSRSFLNTPASVARFLTLTRPAPSLAPWDIGLALKQANGNADTLDSATLLTHVFNALRHFGLSAEAIHAKHWRLWLDGRMLGELIIADGAKSRLEITRRAVFTRQFSQGILSLPTTLRGAAEAERVIQMLSDTISQMATSQHYYLLSRDSLSQETQQLASQWLARVLAEKLSQQLPRVSERESLANAHGLAQDYYHASLALAFFSGSPAKEDPFQAHFRGEWHDAESQYQSSSPLVQEGALLYRRLWNYRLSQYLSQHTQLNENDLFTLLLVNPDQLSLDALLVQILGHPQSHDELIRNIAHDIH
ncbi:M3 family metallopeptidase [Shewanella sp.]|uniref:M3 family metallopeptidase n=1 Tax=Shewanella sp. TaxID=50422 RepID=UPI0035646D80